MLYITANGDKHAFAELYHASSAQIYAVALNMLKRPELADEATQDAFVKIWHNAGQYQRATGTVLTCMASIVRPRIAALLPAEYPRRQKHADQRNQ